MNDNSSSSNSHNILKRGLRAWSMVLILVVMIPAVYGYLYYNNRDTYLTSHYFRSLSEIERQINQGLIGLDKLMDSSWVKGKGFCKGYYSYLEKRFCENYADYLIQYSGRYKNIQFFKSSKGCLSEQEAKETSEYNDKTCFEITGVINNLKTEVFQKQDMHAVKVPLKDLIDPAPALKYFDQILLLDKEGDLIYRSGADDLSTSDNYSARDDYSRFENLQYYLQRDTTWQLDADKKSITSKETKRPPSHSTIREATIGNVTYRLFIQPFHAVRPQYTQNQNSDDKQNNKWIVSSQPGELAYIIGVVPEQNYVFDVISLPMGRITILIFLALTLMLLTPHMKLVFSGVQFMPGRLFVYMLGISFPLLILLGVIGLLSINEYYKLRESYDKTAEKIAEKISNNFAEEFEHLVSVSGVVTTCLEEVEFPPSKSNIGGNYRLLKPETNCYPPFEMLFYLDKQGKQASVQYTYRNFPSLKIVASKRKYFKQPRYSPENLSKWTRKDDASLIPYFSERIQTYDHGIKLTAVSFPCDTGNCRPKDARVKVLIKRLQTFFQPVLPIGFGFAMINDASGDVIYHSNNQRSLLENFYIESDENSELIAVILSRRQKLINANYNGSEHRFLSTPIKNTPWSLVVFYDKALMELVSFKISSYSLFIGFLCIVALSILLMVFCCNQHLNPRLLQLLPGSNFWAKSKTRWPVLDKYFEISYLLMLEAVLIIGCGFIACMVFTNVNAVKIKQLSQLNLMHIGKELTLRNKVMVREINRAVNKEENVHVQPGEFSYLQKNDKLLLGFANYAMTNGDTFMPAYWLASLKPGNVSAHCTEMNKSDTEDWELFFPIFNPVDARYRQAFFNYAEDQSWCVEQNQTGDILTADFRQPGYHSPVTIQGLVLPTKNASAQKLMDKLYLLTMIVFLPVIYNLLKQTAIRLLGLGFPCIKDWEEILVEFENKLYGKNSLDLEHNNAEDSGENLHLIASAKSGQLLELKTILFNRSRNSLVNTANILPLMCLLHSKIFINNNGRIEFKNPKIRRWVSEQPWDKEINRYQTEEQTNLWQLVAPMFYTSLLFIFALLMLSGGNMVNMLLSVSPFLIAGGVPFIVQMFGKLYRH